MAIKKPVYQLKLDLDLPDDEQDELYLGADEIRLRAETSRAALEGGTLWPNPNKVPEWYEKYQQLVIGKWPWRVAVLIAWLAQPRPRWPETQLELAKLMGLRSDRQFSVWRGKNPSIDEQVQSIQFGMVFEHLGDVIKAGVTVASKADYKGRGDRELVYKLAGILRDKVEIGRGGSGEYGFSFEDLLHMAGLDDPEQIAMLKQNLTRHIEDEDAGDD